LLWAGQSGDRIPLDLNFPSPVQTSPEVHPASYGMDTQPLSRGGERRGYRKSRVILLCLFTTFSRV